MLEHLKLLLEGGAYQLAVVVVFGAWLVGTVVTPRSCERACPSCPWDQDGVKRRRFWRARLRLVRLEVALDALLLTWALGRVVTDVLLHEVAWTLPLLAGFGGLVLHGVLHDLRELDRVRARAREAGVT